MTGVREQGRPGLREWADLGELGRAPTPRVALRSLGGMLVRLAAFVLLFAGILFLLFAALMAGDDPGESLGAIFTSSAIMLVAALVAGMALIRALDHRSPGALGTALTERTGRELGVGLAIGAGALAVAVLLSLPAGLGYRAQEGSLAGWLGMAVLTLAGFGVAAFAEEALFRGYPFQVLVRGIGAGAATVLLSALFAWAHAGNPEVGAVALVNIFLAGVLLSVAYLRTASLWFATAVHLGWNWTMATLFDLPVSGIALVDVPLYEPIQGGAGWFTGGAFGPEGGVVGTVGFAVALLAVLRWPRHGMAPRMGELAPLIMDTGRGR
jgi:hypothetical protein